MCYFTVLTTKHYSEAAIHREICIVIWCKGLEKNQYSQYWVHPRKVAKQTCVPQKSILVIQFYITYLLITSSPYTHKFHNEKLPLNSLLSLRTVKQHKFSFSEVCFCSSHFVKTQKSVSKRKTLPMSWFNADWPSFSVYTRVVRLLLSPSLQGN